MDRGATEHTHTSLITITDHMPVPFLSGFSQLSLPFELVAYGCLDLNSHFLFFFLDVDLSFFFLLKQSHLFIFPFHSIVLFLIFLFIYFCFWLLGLRCCWGFS